MLLLLMKAGSSVTTCYNLQCRSTSHGQAPINPTLLLSVHSGAAEIAEIPTLGSINSDAITG